MTFMAKAFCAWFLLSSQRLLAVQPKRLEPKHEVVGDLNKRRVRSSAYFPAMTLSSCRTASAFSALLNGSEAIIANAAAKSVVGSVAGIGTAVVGLLVRAFFPPPSACFADPFSVEPVQGMVQGFAGP